MSTSTNGVSSPFYDDEHEAYREVVRQFTEKEITPNVHEWDLAGEIPRELYNKAGAIGLFGDGFDAEYGGHGQRDALMRFVLMEELCRCGSGGVVAAFFSNYIGLPPIQRFGSDEMKARVITPCQIGEKIAALAITEPSGGSDVARIKTTARRDGDEYVVNGSKTFITSGMRADFFTTAVRTGPEGPGGISLLLIEGDRPGLDRTKLDKMGWLASDTATLYFDDLRVPVANLITEENAGFSAIVNNFNPERIDLAIQSMAFSRVCLRRGPRLGPRAGDIRQAPGRPPGDPPQAGRDGPLHQRVEGVARAAVVAAQPGRQPGGRDRRGQGQRHPVLRVLRPRGSPDPRWRQLPAGRHRRAPLPRGPGPGHRWRFRGDHARPGVPPTRHLTPPAPVGSPFRTVREPEGWLGQKRLQDDHYPPNQPQLSGPGGCGGPAPAHFLRRRLAGGLINSA